MPLTRPTLSQIIARMAADLSNNITGATTLALRSLLRILTLGFAGIVHSQYGYTDNAVRELFISTAFGVFLDLLGNQYGIIRKAAIKSTGSGTATGTNGTNIPVDTVLISSTSVRYIVDTAVVIAGGVAVLDLTAQDAGADGNEAAGVSLSFVSPIVGVGTTLTIDADGLTGGTDLETDENYRARILARTQQVPQGGAAHDYIFWALEVDGVTRAWLFEQINGPGTTRLYFVQDDETSIIPGATKIAEVRAYLVSHIDSATGQPEGIPVTAEPGFEVSAPNEQTVDFTIALNPNTAAVQAAVEAELVDLFEREGGPETSIGISKMDEAISIADGEDDHIMSVPAAPATAAFNQVQIVGTITWSSL